MSTAGRPSRTTAATYRRRRLVMLTLTLLVVAGIALGVQALVGVVLGQADPLVRHRVSSTMPQVTDERTAPPTEEELANPVDCQPGTITLDGTLPAAAITAGAGTTLPVDVRNTGQVPCLLDLGGDSLVWTIYSGEDLVWSSQHCDAPTEQRRLLLDLQATDSVVGTWSGTRSAPGCVAEQSVAPAGTYRVVTQILTESDDLLAANEQVFTIT
ncbi:MAG: hypothetical protein ACK5KU_01015 [Beutenbergiaceae bacterium]